MDLYVYNTLTKLHIHVIDDFVIKKPNITHFCIFRYPVSKLLIAYDCVQRVQVFHTSNIEHVRFGIDVISQLI